MALIEALSTELGTVLYIRGGWTLDIHSGINLIVVDCGMTLSSALYFRQVPAGCPYGYATGFLLEDSALNVTRFVALGGRAYRYAGDDELEAWPEAEPGWDGMACMPGRVLDEPRRRHLMHAVV